MTGAGSDVRPDEPMLPDGRQLAVTWGIPDQFGGMTSALLHRSRAFARLAGRDVDIVTFDTRPDYTAVRERLSDAGELVPGIRLRNLYEDLRTTTFGPRPIVHPLGRPGTDDVAITTAPDGSELRVGLRDDRRVLVEHRRTDGTLAVRDELARPAGPERLITAFEPGGDPVRQWTSSWDCYADWLDGLIGDERAFAVTDSKTIAPFMAQYRRPNVVTLHVAHNSHLARVGQPYGLLRPSRRSVFAHLERFDGVVFLTDRQRDDVVALLSDTGNLAVVPNGIDAPTGMDASPPARDRDPLAGVVVAGLTPRKRVAHAIDIVRACRVGGVPVSLTVYGDGPDAAALRARVADAGLAHAVTFAGHRPGAADAFRHASWTLLTSTSEGAPLVLAEAMACGCLPIAYDIQYGPADLIVDGVNGFLVPRDDRAAAVEALTQLLRLPPERRDAMRGAARATAARHDDRRIVAEWGRVERAAALRHDRAQPPLEASVDRFRLRLLRRRLFMAATLIGAPGGSSVTVTLRQRGRGGALLRTRLPAARRLAWWLTERETAFIGTERGLVGSIVVEHGGSRQELSLGVLRPDVRTPARRIIQHVFRRVTGPIPSTAPRAARLR